uniref:ELYS-like domain-containing protein n=1 Tax=Callorhinchus milii TaxID=7868 RepID=A0A4W3JH21_CALMI
MIDGMVAHLAKKQDFLWDGSNADGWVYPPSSLKALLKLYLKVSDEDHLIDCTLLYFLLDVSHFDQIGKDILHGFSSVISVPLSLTRLIEGFWLLDQKQTLAALDVLLHPSFPLVRSWLPWHPVCITKALLNEEVQGALKYIQFMRPANLEERKLHIAVLLHNRCITEALHVLRGQVCEDCIDEMVGDFFESCLELGLLKELLISPFRAEKQVFVGMLFN